MPARCGEQMGRRFLAWSVSQISLIIVTIAIPWRLRCRRYTTMPSTRVGVSLGVRAWHFGTILLPIAVKSFASGITDEYCRRLMDWGLRLFLLALPARWRWDPPL